MELFHHRRSEFVIGSQAHYQILGTQDPRKVEILYPGGLGVFFGRVFYVHSDIIQSARVQKRFQLVGVIAVGVQFNGIAFFSYPIYKRHDVGLQERFPAREHHAVQTVFSGFQKSEKLLFVHHAVVEIGHQSGVLTERTAEVASARKYYARYLIRKVQKRKFVQPFQ